MAKKNFDTSDLINGLAGNINTPEDRTSLSNVLSVPDTSNKAVSRRGRKPMDQQERRISAIVKGAKYDKIVTIAHIEGIPIKDFIDKCFDFGIEAYEKKHGSVKIKHSRKKGNVDDIF